MGYCFGPDSIRSKAVVLSLVLLLRLFCGVLCLVLFAVQYFVSFLVLLGKRKLVTLLWVPFDHVDAV